MIIIMIISLKRRVDGDHPITHMSSNDSANSVSVTCPTIKRLRLDSISFSFGKMEPVSVHAPPRQDRRL